MNAIHFFGGDINSIHLLSDFIVKAGRERASGREGGQATCLCLPGAASSECTILHCRISAGVRRAERS